MCGFVGIVSNNINDKKEWLVKANNLLVHRGPDDCGVFISDDHRIGLAHRRLSILDTSNHGHQPMSLDNYTIVFNGEIYNFKELKEDFIKEGVVFHSCSDTEVILQSFKKWGRECTQYLNGMFAFTIYDRNKNILFIARDRAGEKPLFYSYDQNKKEFLFASELKSLLLKEDISHTIDKQSLDSYLGVGFVPGEKTILCNFSKLPPAHSLELNLENFDLKVWRYWNLPKPLSFLQQNDESLVEELESLLENAVKKQLVADVPIGVLLSGGVDSSIVTALAIRHQPHIKTFFVGFDGFGDYDESPHANLIAEYFNTEHITLNASGVQPELLLTLAKQYDEPIIDSSMIPTFLVSKLVGEHCKVVLGGDGGDELFGGYKHYSKILSFQRQFQKYPYVLRNFLSSMSSSMLPTGFKGKNWFSEINIDFESEIPAVAVYFNLIERKKLIGQAFNSVEKLYKSYSDSSIDLLDRATRMDFINYLAEDILVKVDRASMLNSLEVRAPFLDKRVIEFAFSKVTSSLKTTCSERKILLKQVAKKILPPKFDFQRKQGFAIPLNDWLKSGVWRDFFEETLLSNNTMFDKKYVSSLFKNQDRGMNNSERLFALVMFELWRREYNIHNA